MSSEKEEVETVRDRPRRHVRSETDYDSYIEDSDEMDEKSKTRTDESIVTPQKPKNTNDKHMSSCDDLKKAKNQKLRGINWMVKETQKSGKIGKGNTMRSMSRIIEDKGMKESMFNSRASDPNNPLEDSMGS